jgi:hypothetical protein
LPPREALRREVHLGLVARRRFEPDDLLGGRPRPDSADEDLELRQATGVAGSADLLEQLRGAELGVGLEPRGDDRLVGVELRRDPRPDPRRAQTAAPSWSSWPVAIQW